MKDSISIVVVNWNSGAQITACIDSIERHGCGLVDQTVVVDNGSSDGSDESVDGRQNVTLVRARSNLGFGKACNRGASLINTKYLLFLNPDATLDPDSLPKVLAYMEQPSNSQVGICGLQLRDENGNISRSCTRFPTAGSFIAHVTGLARLFPKLGYFMHEWDHAETRRVDHVIGAFFLVRRDLYTALNGFDEAFFVYLEDLDFSYRAHKEGWLCVYLTDAQAFHLGGGTSDQVKSRRLFYSVRSRLLYAYKHFSFVAATGVLLATLLIEPVSRSVLAVMRGSWDSLKETWSGYIMLLRWLPRWLLLGETS